MKKKIGTIGIEELTFDDAATMSLEELQDLKGEDLKRVEIQSLCRISAILFDIYYFLQEESKKKDKE
jgi:hypothetical protein